MQVLKAIMAAGPVARTDLPGMTGLAAGTVSQITADLLERGFVTERRETAKRNGRPRMLLEIAAEGPIVIGASISMQRSLLTTFVDLSGTVRFASEVGYSATASLSELASQVSGALLEALDRSGIAKTRIEHVGIGVPALVDSIGGVIYFMTSFDDVPFPFAASIERQIGIPVTIEKNMTAMARAEHWAGCATSLNSFTLIHLGFGLDSACYVDGIPKTGGHGIAPELEHIKTDYSPDAEPCYCGSRGCVATYASIFGIVQRAGLLDSLPVREADIAECRVRFERLLQSACAGDTDARRLFDSAGDHLGRLVADHINMNDPAHVLILCDDPRFSRQVESSFHRTLRQLTIPGMLDLTPIEFSSPMDNWQSAAIAALALEKA